MTKSSDTTGFKIRSTSRVDPEGWEEFGERGNIVRTAIEVVIGMSERSELRTTGPDRANEIAEPLQELEEVPHEVPGG